MRVATGVDHGGFPLEGPIVDYLTANGEERHRRRLAKVPEMEKDS